MNFKGYSQVSILVTQNNWKDFISILTACIRFDFKWTNLGLLGE